MLNRWWMLALCTAHVVCIASEQGVSASDSEGIDWKAAQEEDLIKGGLPGQPQVQFKQYSGYVTVNESAGRALFYWLTEADMADPLTKPLILWLSGGPGCSSIAFGAMKNIGPFQVFPNASGLAINTYAWNKVANLLFLESPAGVGFSYTNTSSDLLTTGDERTAHDAHVFLLKWFERFPQYKGRVFYIMGDSYAGNYVPQLAKLVYDNDVKGADEPDINLKGVMVGNGVLDLLYDSLGQTEYWWYHALISEDSYQALLSSCDYFQANVSTNCTQMLKTVFVNELGDFDPYSIYTPLCQTISQSRDSASLRCYAGYDPCLWEYGEVYFNKPDVQKALHANLTGIGYNWTGCSAVLYENWQDSAFSVIPIYKELILAGLKIWLYSGDADAVVPITSTRNGVEHMNLTKQEKWFSWYHDGEVAGRCQAYEGLALVTVRAAGHEVPYMKPDRAYVLIESYLQSDHRPLLPRNQTSS